jgi:GT2 family glycosyltransferase
MLQSSDITRIIIGYNSADILQFSYFDPVQLPTLLVDNSRSPETLQKAEKLGYRTLSMGYNSGYGRAINVGLKAISTSLAIITNPDVAFSASDIDALISASSRYLDAFAFVPRLFRDSGEEHFRFSGKYEPRISEKSPQDDACIPMLNGAVLLVRRKEFLEFGGFDNNIFLYFEDDDLAMRMRRSKTPIIFVASARFKHLGNQSTTPTEKVSALRCQAFGWSWAYFMRKHRVGSLAGAIFLTIAKSALHTSVLATAKAKRDVQIALGLISYLFKKKWVFEHKNLSP